MESSWGQGWSLFSLTWYPQYLTHCFTVYNIREILKCISYTVYNIKYTGIEWVRKHLLNDWWTNKWGLSYFNGLPNLYQLRKDIVKDAVAEMRTEYGMHVSFWLTAQCQGQIIAVRVISSTSFLPTQAFNVLFLLPNGCWLMPAIVSVEMEQRVGPRSRLWKVGSGWERLLKVGGE